MNVVTFGAGCGFGLDREPYLTAAELVPPYGLMVCAFGVLCMAGIGLTPSNCGLDGFGCRSGAAGAAVLVLAGIFVMRFAFGMMHMTVGLG